MPAVTAIRLPESGQAPRVVARLRDEHGVQVAGGQGELKPYLFRIGHLGYIDEVDLLGTLGALERVLRAEGFELNPGRMVAAACGVLDEGLA